MVIEQVRLGEATASLALDVVSVDGPTTGTAVAVGNAVSGGVEGSDLTLQTDQTLDGAATASVAVTGSGTLGAPVHLTASASGNLGAATIRGGALSAEARQRTLGSTVRAETVLAAPSGRALSGGTVSATAVANAQGWGVQDGSATIDTVQAHAGLTEAELGAVLQYAPAPIAFTATAVSNSVSASGANAAQSHAIDQSMTGQRTQAAAFAAVGNGWNAATVATAAANTTALTNQGGALDAAVLQSNTAYVRAQGELSAFDFGRGAAFATGVGNATTLTAAGPYVGLALDQINAAGVDAVAAFSGDTGYDAYVGATAVGNSASALGCSDCGGVIEATGSQTNSGAVTAQASATVTGSGRATVGSATAVGNSATYGVTR